MKRLLTLSVFSLFLLNLFAQKERLTCHQMHQGVHPKALTKKQKEMIIKSNQRSDTFDILNYEINIDITDYGGQTIKANTNISVKSKVDGAESIRFDLLDLTVDSVKITGLDAPFSHDGEYLDVDLPSISVSEEEFIVSVWYQGHPHQDPQWGGFYFESNYIYNLGIGLSTIPPNFGKVWYPCFDTFVERATYDYHVLSDDGFIPKCQGVFNALDQLEGDTVLAHYSMNIPIATYLSAIAASDYETIEYVHEGAYGPRQVELYAKAGLTTSMDVRFIHLPEAIDALEYWWGPYIWNKVGYVMTTVGAMEHASNIAYPQSMMGASTYDNDGLLSHELGHHWWGDLTGTNSYNNMWIKEGTAEYSQHLTREWLSGPQAFINEVKDNQLFVLEAAHIDDGGFFPLSPIPDEVIYGRHTYYKGAAVMHNMRGYLGDSLFREGLQAVLDTFYLDHMDPDQFNSALSNSTGVDMTSFFNDQIYSSGWSTFIIDSVQVLPIGQGYDSHLFVQQKLRECPQYYTNVPMEVTFVFDDWSSETFTQLLSGEVDDFTYFTEKEPVMYILNRANNLNTATMDYEAVLTETTNTETLPWAEMKLKVEGIGDSSLFRASHHWVRPDDALMGEDILDISDTHYWTVGGIWSEGLDLVGRIYYTGFESFQLDHDLVADTEDNIGLVYRNHASQPWEIYPYYTLIDGSNNGNGQIKIDSLLAGDYAFANIEQPVGVEEYEEESIFSLYPNPTEGELYLTTQVPGDYSVSVFDMNGREVLEKQAFIERSNAEIIDLNSLAKGAYSVVLSSPSGRYTESIVIVKE